MPPVSRFELVGDEYLDTAPKCRKVILRVGWLGFLHKFSGFNLETSRVFAASFDGIKAQVGDIKFRLTEELVSQAIGLPQIGEHWYKGKHVKNDDWKEFLTPAHWKTKYKSGFPSRLLMKKLRSLLDLLSGTSPVRVEFPKLSSITSDY